jgi:L-threonylcarbamoyladenylate synthase
MEIISNPNLDEIRKAAKALKDGHLVAFPTETVYGLGADATNEKAIRKVYSVKERPTNHPLIVHISSLEFLRDWAVDIPEYALKLSIEFWPGPMTLILKRSELAHDFITGGQDSIGLRIPNEKIALDLLRQFELLGGQGIAAPSANRFGAVSPTTSNAVKVELEKFLNHEDIILNSGQCLIGIESTIIDCTFEHPLILRPGAITREQINKVVKLGSLMYSHKSITKVSGSFSSHYSPEATIEISDLINAGEGMIAMAKFITPDGVIRLAAPNNIQEYAHQLYEAFRNADLQGLKKIKVILPEEQGLGEAIKDRIIKASFKKKYLAN